MKNPFDQFDSETSKNPFDQFDEDNKAQKKEPISTDVGQAKALLISLGKGFTDIGKGLGLMPETRPSEKQAYQALEQKYPITTMGGEITGQALPFIPAALGVEAAVPALALRGGFGTAATQASRVAGQGTVGATEGGLIAGGTDGDVVQGSLIGGGVAAGIEAVSPVAGRAISAVFRRLTGKAPQGALVTANGLPTPELQQAISQYGLSFDDITNEAASLLSKETPENADEVARKLFLESQGIQPTRAQVTRGATDFQAQQEAAKTSGRVRQALEEQEAILSTRFDNAVIDSQSKATTPDNVVGAVTDKATRLDSEISSLYKQAREIAPDSKNVRFGNLATLLKEKAPSNTATGGAVEAIVGELQSKGILTKDMKIGGRVDIKTAEEVRKYVNTLYDPQQPFRNIVLREVKEALDEDVFKSTGGDLFNQSRRAKANFEKELERAGVSKFDSRRTNIVRDVLENKVNPDRLVDEVVISKKYRASDLSQLKNYIAQESPDAVFNLKADTLQYIKDKVFIGPEDASGYKALSRAALERELSKIGKEKLNALFDPKEVKFLNDMLTVSKLREPVRGTALGEGPSAQAISKLKIAVKELPLLGNFIDSVGVDMQGRAVLKSKPKQLPREATKLEKNVTATGAAALIPALTSEE